MLFWFRKIYAAQAKRIGLGILLAFIASLSGVSLLMLSGWFISATALAGIAISAGIIIIFDMYMPGASIRFFALSRTVSRYAERLYNHDTILRLVALFRLTLFKQLSQLSVNELRKTSDSEWLSRLTADLDALDSLLLRFTITPIVLLLIIICSTTFTYFIWPAYALVIGGFMLLCAVFTIVFTIKKTKSLGKQNSSILNAMRAHIIEHLQGRFELKAQMLVHRHERHAMSSLAALDEVQREMNQRIANIQLILDLLLAVGLSALVYIAMVSVNAEQIDGPIAILAVLMFVAITELLQVLPSQYKAWGASSYSANRLSAKGMPKAHIKKAFIYINNNDVIDVVIDKHPQIIGSQNAALKFSLSKNQPFVISGKSGAGKSTVANIIAGITYRPILQQSEVSISLRCGERSQKLPLNFSWEQLGYLTQSNSILAGSLAYNLRLGIEDLSDEALWKVLALVELEDWAQSLEKGLYSWLGETGSQVSGGQARRIALARLLLRDPRLVILDEPFNGLDQNMAERIWQNMGEWLCDKRVVLLSHEFPTTLMRESATNHVNLDS